MQLGTVPIPKSVTKERIRENIGVFDFQLNDSDLAVLDSFNTGKRMCPFTDTRHSKDFPFSIEF